MNGRPLVALTLTRSRKGPSTWEVLDEEAPYVRLSDPDLRPSERGAWVDLEPDTIDVLIAAEPAAAGKFTKVTRTDRSGKRTTWKVPKEIHDWVDITHRGGAVRARLHRLGVARAEWEAATPGARATVVAAAEAIERLEGAAFALVMREDLGLRNAASNLLDRVAKVVSKDDDYSAGFAAQERKADHEELVEVVEHLEHLFAVYKKRGLAGRRNHLMDAGWTAPYIELINRDLRFAGLAEACTATYFHLLVHQTPKQVAQSLVSAARRDLSVRDLRGAAPQRRRK